MNVQFLVIAIGFLFAGNLFGQSEFETTPTSIKAKKETDLSSAAIVFNEIAAKNERGKSEPSLTSDEIHAAVLNWLENYNDVTSEDQVSDEIRSSIGKLGAKQFPMQAELRFITTRQKKIFTFEIWKIELQIGDLVLPIRDRYLSGRQLTSADFPKPVVKGDLELLVKIRDANKKHFKENQFGHWKGSVRRESHTGEIEFKWSGENSRIDYKVFDSGQDGYGIRTATKQMIFFGTDQKAIIYLGLGRSFYPPMECHPKDSWYSYDESIPWHQLLDHENVRGRVGEFRVSKNDDSNILIKRIYEDSCFAITVSPELDYRIVKYEPENVDDVRWASGEIVWKKNDAGVTYPEHLA